MAFDAGMLSAVVRELDNTFSQGAKVEKIYMPDRDEIHIITRLFHDTKRLVVSASPSCARVGFSDLQKENPPTPPTLCMLLRKKLSGARITAVRQLGFERALEIEFDTRDEMGFSSKKYLIAEIMGKHSNIIFTDADYKILGAVRTVDATSSLKRRIIGGVRYELPPSQDKLDPTKVNEREFFEKLESFEKSTLADKAILSSFFGMAPIICREIVFRASGESETALEKVNLARLWEEFSRYFTALEKGDFYPILLFYEGRDTAFEYSVYPILQYGADVKCVECETVSALIDSFFSLRDKSDRMKQRSQDISRLLTNAQNRLLRKIEAQKAELASGADMETCRLFGDLITQEMYRIKKGDLFVEALDYSSEPYKSVRVELDEKLTPSQNAQRYYKQYNRKKNAVSELGRQIELSSRELEYIDTVFDALSRAESEKDLAEIREELSLWGYMKRDAKRLNMPQKKQSPRPMSFVSPSGYEVLVGRNNLQNDYLTTKLSDKNDWWFHVKNYSGSHVVMRVENREEPPAEDFTYACSLAARYSSPDGERVEVDYTQIRYVKKPAGSKPGFVTYTTYWSAVVDKQ